VEGAERGRGIGESKRHNQIKRPFIRLVVCLSHGSSLARLLPRYAPGSSPTVDPTSRSISRFLIRAKKSAIKVDTCS
jgi:hypothetical protein